VSNSTDSDARVLEDDLAKSVTEVAETKHLPILQNLPIANNLIIPCRVIAVQSSFQSNLKHLDSSFGQSKPLCQRQYRRGPLLSSGPSTTSTAFYFKISTRLAIVGSWSWDLATWRQLQSLSKYEFARWDLNIWSGGKRSKWRKDVLLDNVNRGITVLLWQTPFGYLRSGSVLRNAVCKTLRAKFFCLTSGHDESNQT
jgi:hypothetical protein